MQVMSSYPGPPPDEIFIGYLSDGTVIVNPEKYSKCVRYSNKPIENRFFLFDGINVVFYNLGLSHQPWISKNASQLLKKLGTPTLTEFWTEAHSTKSLSTFKYLEVFSNIGAPKVKQENYKWVLNKDGVNYASA